MHDSQTHGIKFLPPFSSLLLLFPFSVFLQFQTYTKQYKGGKMLKDLYFSLSVAQLIQSCQKFLTPFPVLSLFPISVSLHVKQNNKSLYFRSLQILTSFYLYGDIANLVPRCLSCSLCFEINFALCIIRFILKTSIALFFWLYMTAFAHTFCSISVFFLLQRVQNYQFPFL